MGHLSSIAYIEPEFVHLCFLAQAQPPRRAALSRIRVLVVDDDLRIADTTGEVLEHAGFEVQVTYTAESALRIAASFRPDCLLTDVLMPRINGVELGLEFRRAHPAARVVLISGQIGISDILDDAERRGLDFELLAKPIHPRKLIEHLRQTRKL